MDTGKLAGTIQATPPTHPSITTIPLTGIATVPGMSMERQALASAVPGMGTERQALASGPLALVDGNCRIGELPLRNLRTEPLTATCLDQGRPCHENAQDKALFRAQRVPRQSR